MSFKRLPWRAGAHITAIGLDQRQKHSRKGDLMRQSRIPRWHSLVKSANRGHMTDGHADRVSRRPSEAGLAALNRNEAPMKFRPLHDRVVIRRIEGEEKTKGGIIIPDTVKEKPQEGEVIAIGPGARDESGKLVPLDLKKGDRVLFGKWSGTEVKIDGEDLLIMKESDVMGVIEGAVAAKKAA
jgi:chaperonin GroES